MWTPGCVLAATIKGPSSLSYTVSTAVTAPAIAAPSQGNRLWPQASYLSKIRSTLCALLPFPRQFVAKFGQTPYTLLVANLANFDQMYQVEGTL